MDCVFSSVLRFFGTSHEKNVFKPLPVIASNCKARGDPLNIWIASSLTLLAMTTWTFLSFTRRNEETKFLFFSASLFLRVSFFKNHQDPKTPRVWWFWRAFGIPSPCGFAASLSLRLRRFPLPRGEGFKKTIIVFSIDNTCKI